MDLNITDDSFSKIFDDVIQTPNTMLSTNTNEEQKNGSDRSRDTTIKEYGSEPVSNLPTNLNNSFANLFTNNFESSSRIDNPYVSVSQPKNNPKVSSKDIQCVLESKTNSSNTNLTTLKSSKERASSPYPHPQEKHSPITNYTTSPLPPKKKRRPRAKKILTLSETLRVRERYLEKNRHAARKFRLKKKIEIAAAKQKHDFYIAEICFTKNQLINSQRELLNLIEICKEMVKEEYNDTNLRRFIAKWERREEACRGMLESGDVGVEAWKLIEKCRSARLGEGVLGNVTGLEEDRKGLICSENVWSEKAGCEARNEVTSGWGNYDIDMGITTEVESQSNNSSGITECDEPVSYGFCQPSPMAQQTQVT